MKKAFFLLANILFITLIVHEANAEKIRVFVSRFGVSSTENRDDIKNSLQTLLMSRLSSEQIQIVEARSEAELLLEGSYIVFGNVFSIDSVVKKNSGEQIDRIFVQGDSQNELIPAVSELAARIKRIIVKFKAVEPTPLWQPSLEKPAAAPVPEAKPVVTPPTASSPSPPVVPKPETAPVPLPLPVKKSEPVRAVVPVKTAEAAPVPTAVMITPEKPWSSQRFPGQLSGIAMGAKTKDDQEIFLTSESQLSYYLKGETLQFLARVEMEPEERIIGVDAADRDNDGFSEIYLSVMKGGTPSSRIYKAKDRVLKKVADEIPYALRAVVNEGGEKRIYAQKIDANGSFSGDLLELENSTGKIVFGKALKMPLFGNLYNFTRINDQKRKQLTVVTHPEGYILVYSRDNKLLWKSRDKFAGSEPGQCKSDGSSTTPACGFPLPQRILTLPDGDIIVPRNIGATGKRNLQNYAKSSMVRFTWNGSAMVEKSRSPQNQSYIADSAIDKNPLMLTILEVEPKKGDEPRGSRVIVRGLE